MKTISVFQLGDIVGLSPVWFALHTNEDEDAEYMRKWAEFTKHARGVVTEITMHADLLPSYHIEWQSAERLNYVAWFGHDELRLFDSDCDWDNIPFEQYRNDWRSVNKPSKREFARLIGADISAAIEHSIIETVTVAQG